MASMDAVIQRTPPVVARTHWETAPQLTRLRARNTSVLFRIGIDSRTIAELESRYGRHFTYAVDAVHEHGGFTWFLAETHGDGFAIWLEGEPMHRVEGIEGMMEDVKGCRRYNFDVDISLSFDERAARGHLGLIVTAKQVCQGLWDRWPRVEMSAGFFKPPVDDVDPPTEAATKRTRLGSRRRGSTKKDKREPQKAAGQTKGRQLPQEKQEDGQTRPYDSEKRPCESGKRPCDDEKSEKRPKTGKQEST
ncbi:uncharacterized protein PFL1_05299 [Pseudozyma flocculosa PF-1]|uniref:Uncharacterized protein n=2 Tax=Pseudozyma flocculosa TaxID=84751 RepID=A0A5C3FEU9_9BASI|nr:uncharacterized protein PFL1_05299 [Pseudozyma flocculosa PF-1]EPQ27015.1 hypothetical protein PFL1_05299 [Pseudozyma flocculosa PF-1]SPO42011.1 uncharacterized protein PSFLO_07494 [Pseudozyma flocculosa]